MNLSESFQTHLQTTGLIKKGQSVFVACSGGADSVALFSLLCELREDWKLKLGLLHVNHQLRGRSSDADERFVKALAKRYKVPCAVRKKKIQGVARKNKASLEEAAREVRYECLALMAKKGRASRVVTAHTQDDQAETVLMRVLQGTGLRGLSGIRQTLKMKGISFTRPLLPFSKKELLQYLTRRKAKYRMDASNHSSRFLRNRIRHQLVPQLKRSFNPRVMEAISRLPRIVAEENKLLTELEQTAWKKVKRRQSGGRLQLDRSVFLRYPGVLQYRVLEKALKKLDARSGLSYEAWARIRPALTRARYRCSLPRDLDFSLTRTGIEVTKKKPRK